ncbi:MAG: DUF1761 domain-containing protein [Saprospiraceae bacterium]|nr:DUF1761 domain-containing protein [Saprospiraceae bacterium]
MINWIAVLCSALVPLVVGFVWYGPLFGKAWMRATGLTEEQLKGANMAVIFGLTFVFSIMASLALYSVVVHQFHIFSLFVPDPGLEDGSTEAGKLVQQVLALAGDGFRTFKHGAFHGLLFSLFMVLPLIGINGLFERRSWKYIFLHTGYWAVTLMLMGGILCAWK